MEEQIKQPENNNIIKVDFQDKKLLMIIIVLICVVGLMCGITFALYMNQRNSSNNEISTKVSVSRYSLSNIASSNTVTSESTVVSTNVNTSVSNDTKYLTYSDDIVSFQYPDFAKVGKQANEIYNVSWTEQFSDNTGGYLADYNVSYSEIPVPECTEGNQYISFDKDTKKLQYYLCGTGGGQGNSYILDPKYIKYAPDNSRVYILDQHFNQCGVSGVADPGCWNIRILENKNGDLNHYIGRSNSLVINPLENLYIQVGNINYVISDIPIDFLNKYIDSIENTIVTFKKSNTSVSNDTRYLTYSDDVVSFQYPDGWKVVKNMDEVSFTLTNGVQKIKLSRTYPIDCSGEIYFNETDLRTLYVGNGNMPPTTTNYNTYTDIKYFNINLKESSLKTALVFPPNIGDIPGMYLMQKGKNPSYPDRYTEYCNMVMLKASQYYYKANPLYAYDIALSIESLSYSNDAQAINLANIIETFTNSFKFNETQNVNGFNYTHNEGRFVRFDYPEGADITIKKFSLCQQGGGYCLIDGAINSVNDIGSIEISKNYGSYSQSITLFLGRYGDWGTGYTKYLGNETFEINAIDRTYLFVADRSKLFMELKNNKFGVWIVGSMDYNSNGLFSNNYPIRIFTLANENGFNGYYLEYPIKQGYIQQYVDSGKLTIPGMKGINLECGIKDIADGTEANIRLNKCFLMADTFMNSFEIK